MKRIQAFFQALKNNRKLRCGGFSVALTAAVAICALLLGALADSVEARYALQADFSFNGATTQGEVTRAVLAQLDRDVQLRAVVPADGGDETLLSLLERYRAASPRVTLTRESLVKNPVLQTQFADAAGETRVTDDCLIVTCPDTGRTRVLTAQDYIRYSYNLETGYFDEASFSYEKSITEAILYVTRDDVPAIQILTGHGEMDGSDTSILEETLTSANYELRRVNLMGGDALDPGSVLMILAPRYDFSEQEIEALMAFARAGGDFFLVSQYTDPLTLSNYQSFLRSFGIEAYPGLVIAKAEDTDSYYGDSPVILMPYMQETDATRSLLAAGEDILLFSAARAFKAPAYLPEGVSLSPVLVTGEAYIRDYSDGLNVTDQQPSDPEGRFAVALWADKLFEDGETSHALILGDGTMFLNYWMQSSTASTPFLLQMVRSLQGQDPVNLEILPKTALRDGLSLGDLTPGLIVIIMLPLLVALGAALVLWPRRNL